MQPPSRQMLSKRAGKKPGKSEDPLRSAAELLRGRTGPEVRGARLQDARVDVFRSKDLLRLLRDKPPSFLDALYPANPDSSSKDAGTRLEEQIAKLGYIFRVERVVKERSKGRKHVKFPKAVEPHPVQAFTDGGFYVWRLDAPRTLLSTVAPYLALVLVLCATLFPIAPYRLKLGVVYASMGLLSAIFAVTILRLLLFIAVWVLTGRSIWLLPNLYSEEIPITQLLSPLVSETKPKAGEDPPGVATRLAVAAAVIVFCVSVYGSVPEGVGVVSGVRGGTQSVLDMLNLSGGPKSIGDGTAGNASTVAPAQPPPISNAAAAAAVAAAALKGGKIGPAGVKGGPSEKLSAEKISNLAPVPEEEELEEREAEGVPGGEGNAPGEDAAPQEDPVDAPAQEETAAEL